MDLHLPDNTDAILKDHESPALFLSLPDAMAEFKSIATLNVLKANNAFTH
eukprot:SAG22_NODE_4644_length_1207_cov_0.974729_3_plen_49_part_01